MRQRASCRAAIAAVDREMMIQQRLQKEKLKLLVLHALFFILSAGVLLFGI
jgi:hypothetical protein